MFKLVSCLATLAALGLADLAPVEVKGNAFYKENSADRFYLRGVAYQPGGSSNLTDPLADPTICSRDIEYFKELGLNTVRVYSVDNTADHSDCMQMLSDAGIYVLLDVNIPKTSISRGDTQCSYNLDYLTEVFATVEEFAKYNNTLGFFAANELVNSEQYMYLSPYVKAITRDIKQFIKAQNFRQIPVGYSAADVSQIRYELADYLNCGDDADERIDMLGINDYSWCGHSSFQVSGYAEKVKDFAGYSVPIFLSEFGCNKVPSDRPFTEVGAIYSEQMSPVFSGGVVYQYFQDTNNYGLVEIGDDGKVQTLTDFTNLQNEFQSTPDPTGDAGAGNYSFAQCPTTFNFSIAVPPQIAGLTDLIQKGPDGDNIGFFANTQEACEDEDDNDSSSSSSSSTSSVASSTPMRPSSFATSTTSQTVVSSISSATHKNNATGSSDQGSFFFQLSVFLLSLAHL